MKMKLYFVEALESVIMFMEMKSICSYGEDVLFHQILSVQDLKRQYKALITYRKTQCD